MLVRLAPADVQLGMFIHSFEGRWSDRPFWQSGFVLTDGNDLDRLRKSGIPGVLIDTAKCETPPRRASQEGGQRPPAKPVRRLDAATLRASRTVNRARKAMLKLGDDIRLGRPIVVAQLAPLVADLSEQVASNSGALLGLLRIKSRDQYTYLHSVAVAALMMNLARTMRVAEADLPAIGLAGLLHDAGKLDIPEAILNKPGALDEEEFRVMRSHPLRGHRILSLGQGMSPVALDVCLHHHERPDGLGYPHGLGGARLSMAARMGAVCDVYDALTSDRAYKDAWSPQRALAAMLRWTGQFDPAVLNAFVRSLGIYPVGSLVRVRDTALAIVIADNDQEPTCPTVRSFYSIASRSRVRCEDIAIKSPHVLTLDDPAAWDFADWPAMSDELMGHGDASPAVAGERA